MEKNSKKNKILASLPLDFKIQRSFPYIQTYQSSHQK